ncbi:MAG: flagellar hook protein, partial [Clostridiales bacterium]|nr:flagellar hook protein [Clostridiales bacterium]
MSSVSSSSSSSSSSSLSGSFNRITGLSSGLDTETTIKGLTQGTQTKIDKQKQKLQLLQWKQQEYQDIATKLNDFQNKYFGTSSYSMLFSKELHSFAVTNSGSNYVKVTTSSDSVTGNIYIGDIVSLATAASVKSESKVSADPVLNV